MSYQEERKFFTYFTNINLRALLMSDGIINDLRGSMEQHSQNHTSHQSFHISSAHTVLLDLWRISQATRRRYGAEGNAGKYGTFDLDLSRLVFCFSLRWQWQLILQPVLGFCDFFFFGQVEFTNFRPHPRWCWASHLQSLGRIWSPWGSSLQEMGVPPLCTTPERVPCNRQPPLSCRQEVWDVVFEMPLVMPGLQ